MDEIMNKFRQLEGMIGRTPMVKVDFKYKGRACCIYAKAEHYNLSGSIKDRVAFHILRQSYLSGAIRPGQEIAEATSGNTGIAFAAVGAYMGNPVTIYMPDWMSVERVRLIESFGAVVRGVTKQEGGFTGSIRLAEEHGKRGAFLPRQFENALNTEAHFQATGPEILAQLEAFGRKPDAFVAGVGTGGTIMGVSAFLKQRDPACLACALDPASSPTLYSGGTHVGPHRIAGIGDEFIPEIVKLDKLDRLLLAHDGDAINMSRKLAAKLGLAVGISSGANFIGCLHMIDELGPDACIVTCFADDNKKYLSTDLMYEQPEEDDYLSGLVELEGFTAIRFD